MIRQHCKTNYHTAAIKEAGFTQIWNRTSLGLASPPPTPSRKNGNGQNEFDNDDTASETGSYFGSTATRKRATNGERSITPPLFRREEVDGLIDGGIANGSANEPKKGSASKVSNGRATADSVPTELAKDALNSSANLEQQLEESEEESEFSDSSSEDDGLDFEIKTLKIDKLKYETKLYRKLNRAFDQVARAVPYIAAITALAGALVMVELKYHFVY